MVKAQIYYILSRGGMPSALLFVVVLFLLLLVGPRQDFIVHRQAVIWLHRGWLLWCSAVVVWLLYWGTWHPPAGPSLPTAGGKPPPRHINPKIKNSGPFGFATHYYMQVKFVFEIISINYKNHESETHYYRQVKFVFEIFSITSYTRPWSKEIVIITCYRSVFILHIEVAI